MEIYELLLLFSIITPGFDTWADIEIIVAIIISYKFFIKTQINVIHSTWSQRFQFITLKTLLNSLE